MAIDTTLLLKTAIIQHLSSSPEVTSLVPAERIFGMQVPSLIQWPFIRYGSPIPTGFEASCWDGTRSRITIHGFAETDEVDAGENKAINIGSAIVSSLNDFAPATLGIVDNQWINTNLLKDDNEADRWHVAVQFEIVAVIR